VRDFNRGSHGWTRITAAAINQVILGARASEEFEREVRKAAALKSIPKNRVIKARIDPEKYGVEF
jgi:hypothetical protein